MGALWLALSLGISSCGAPEEVVAAPEVAPATATTRWVAPSPPADRSLLEAPATVRAVEARGEVTSTFRARVAQVHVMPGSRVAVGDPVLDVLAPELLDAAATYVHASRAAAAHARRASELDALRGEGLASREQVFDRASRAADLSTDSARAAALLQAAGIELRDAPRVVREGHVTLRAPVSGVIVALDARPGEIREPGAGAPFARIAGDGPARIEVRSARAWPSARAIHFEAIDGRQVTLAPQPIASVVDPDDGTRLAWFAPSPAVELPDGLTGTVRLEAADATFEVPVTAVTQRTGHAAVERRRGDAVSVVEVEVLATSGATALVRGALRPTDRVASVFTSEPVDGR